MLACLHACWLAGLLACPQMQTCVLYNFNQISTPPVEKNRTEIKVGSLEDMGLPTSRLVATPSMLCLIAGFGIETQGWKFAKHVQSDCPTCRYALNATPGCCHLKNVFSRKVSRQDFLSIAGRSTSRQAAQQVHGRSTAAQQVHGRSTSARPTDKLDIERSMHM